MFGPKDARGIVSPPGCLLSHRIAIDHGIAHTARSRTGSEWGCSFVRAASSCQVIHSLSSQAQRPSSNIAAGNWVREVRCVSFVNALLALSGESVLSYLACLGQSAKSFRTALSESSNDHYSRST